MNYLLTTNIFISSTKQKGEDKMNIEMAYVTIVSNHDNNTLTALDSK